MEKKSNVGLIVGLIISILCIIGLVGFIVFDKIEENKRIQAPIIDYEKSEKLDEKDVESFLKRIDELNNALYDNYPISDIHNLSTRDILSIGFNDIYGANYIPDTYIENHIRYIIGDNVDIKHEDYVCTNDKIALWKYANGHYILNNDHPGHGGGYGYIITTFFKDASMDDDSITINTNILYEPASDVWGGPTTSYKASPNGEYILNDIQRDSLKSEYEKIKDTLPTTTFTFKRSKLGGYNLEKVTIK